MDPKPTYTDLRQRLLIGDSLTGGNDRDIDQGLVENSDLYFHAAREHALALAEQHAIELEVKEAEAREILKLKAREERISDKMAEMRSRLVPAVRKLQSELVFAKKQVALWKALEGAFDKRASALRELVKWRIQQWNQTHISGGAHNSRTELAEHNHARAGQLRRQLARAGED